MRSGEVTNHSVAEELQPLVVFDGRQDGTTLTQPGHDADQIGDSPFASIPKSL